MKCRLVFALLWWLLVPLMVLGVLLLSAPKKPRKARLERFSDSWIREEMKQ